MGTLEPNPFLPVLVHNLLKSMDLLAQASHLFADRLLSNLKADEQRCRDHLQRSTAVATALAARIGCDCTSELVKEARETERSIREVAVSNGALSEADFDELLSPESLTRLGYELHGEKGAGDP